jgi:ribonuclease BN (tRNA processing enzyme)
MKITMGGVRGTGPVSGENYLNFGGGTTSVLIQGQKGAAILLDAGTGVRELGLKLQLGKVSTRELLLLMTHYHIDHMMGLPSLSVLYSKAWQITMAAPLREGFSVRTMVRRLLAKPFWPVQFSQLQSTIDFKTLKGHELSAVYEYQGFQVRWCSVHHPDGCTAYRIDEMSTGRSLVFATDLEWGKSSRAEKKAFKRLCQEPNPVNLLFFDGQFTSEEYPLFQGWGHSTWEEAVQISNEVGAGKLMVIHHAPTRTDRQIDMLQRKLRKACPGAEFAMGGRVIEL